VTRSEPLVTILSGTVAGNRTGVGGLDAVWDRNREMGIPLWVRFGGGSSRGHGLKPIIAQANIAFNRSAQGRPARAAGLLDCGSWESTIPLPARNPCADSLRELSLITH